MLYTTSEEEHVLAIQTGDDELGHLIGILKKPEERSKRERGEAKGFALKNGLLYRIEETSAGKKWLFVIPKSNRKTMTVEHHDLLGHSYADKRVNKIQRR